jgi:hypothetical protein
MPQESDLSAGWLADEKEVRYDEGVTACQASPTAGDGADVSPADPIYSAARLLVTDDKAVTARTHTASTTRTTTTISNPGALMADPCFARSSEDAWPGVQRSRRNVAETQQPGRVPRSFGRKWAFRRRHDAL